MVHHMRVDQVRPRLRAWAARAWPADRRGAATDADGVALLSSAWDFCVAGGLFEQSCDVTDGIPRNTWTSTAQTPNATTSLP
jgi:hypothetical protein